MGTVLALAAAVWGVAVGTLPLSDNSFLTHLATGRLILDGGIPRHDVFSFTAAGEPWVVQSWLASVIYGGLDQVWGLAGLVAFRTVLTVAVSVLVVRLTRPAGTLGGRLLLVAVALGVGSGLWGERPLLIGLVLLCVLLLAAEGGIDPRWAVPLMWVWANVHGSFPLGLVAVACLAAGRRLDGEHPRLELRVLTWATAGVVLAAVNPLGPKLLYFPLHMLGRSEQLRAIVEWQAPGFELWWQRLFLLQVVLGVVALVRRPSWRAAVPLLVFVPAALLAMRNIPVASIVLVPTSAAGLRGLGTITSEHRSRAVTMAASALAALLCIVAISGSQGRPIDLSGYPVGPLAWMEEQGMLGPSSRVVTEDYVGNYRTFAFGLSARVFVDDRFDMYPADVVEDFLTLRRGRPGWEQVLERRGATAVLWDAELPLASLLRAAPSWRLVHADDDWVVAVPR